MEKSVLIEYFGNFEGLTVSEGNDFVEITVSPQNLHDTAKKLRNDDKLNFDFLFCVSGVDYKNDLGVVYHLRSTSLNHSIVLKTRISDRSNPQVDSVADLWKTADLHEREVFDLLGIRFTNHPDLRRLFLEKTYGFPLRKDFKDDINIVTK